MAPAPVSAKECEVLLSRISDDNYKLLRHQLQPFCERVRGFMGDHLRLSMDFENLSTQRKETMTYFVKAPSNTGMLICFPDIDFFAKEARAFKFVNKVKELIPQIDISIIPKMELSKNDEIFIMEDLSAKKYVGPTDLLLDRLEILKMLESVAKFHAISIVYKATKSKQLGRPYKLSEELDPVVLHTAFPDYESSGKRFVEAATAANVELVKEVYKDDPETRDIILGKLGENAEEFIRILNAENNYYKVLCHGDLWSFNCLFKYAENGEPVDCKLLDFQLVRYAPPALDVVMLLYCVTTESSRQKYLHQYYQHYYNSLGMQLKNNGIDIENVLSWEEFDDTCRRYMFVSKLIWLFYRQTSYSRPEVYEKAKNDVQLFRGIMGGSERIDYVMENFRNDPEYRKNVTRILKKYLDVILHEHISIEDVFKIMANKLNSTDYQLVDFNLKMSEVVMGHMGSHWFLKVKVSRKESENIEEHNFFVKLVPIQRAQVEFSQQTGASIKEMRFYGTIVPKMLEYHLREILDVAPKCYLSNSDALVFDDLSMQDYRIAQARENMRVEDVKKGLSSLAKLHACAIIYEHKLRQERGNKKLRLCDIYKEDFAKTFYRRDLRMPGQLLESYKLGTSKLIDLFYSDFVEIPPAKLKILAAKYIEEYSDNTTKPSEKFANTICHGDLWAANILLSDLDCKLLDFQSYRYSAPTQDVTQFIYFSMYRKDRIKHLPKLLDYYFECFKAVFSNHNLDVDDFMSYEDFLNSVSVDTKFAVMQSITHFQTTLLTAEALEKFFSSPEKASESMFGDRTNMVDYNCKHDEFYRERLRDAMDDFLEICKAECLS